MVYCISHTENRPLVDGGRGLDWGVDGCGWISISQKGILLKENGVFLNSRPQVEETEKALERKD